MRARAFRGMAMLYGNALKGYRAGLQALTTTLSLRFCDCFCCLCITKYNNDRKDIKGDAKVISLAGQWPYGERA